MLSWAAVAEHGRVHSLCYQHQSPKLPVIQAKQGPCSNPCHFLPFLQYHSSLASLNGLEVHLRETLPKDSSSSAKTTYSFAHYDCVQNVLTGGPSGGSKEESRVSGDLFLCFRQLAIGHRPAESPMCTAPVHSNVSLFLATPQAVSWLFPA